VIRNRSTPSFGGEVKPEAPCRKITWEVRIKILRKAKFIIPFAHSSCLLPDDSAGRFAKELLWENQEFSSVNIIPP